MDHTHVIIRPVITEQSMKDAGKGRYTFIIAQNADKIAVKKAVTKAHGVSVVSVTTVITKGRTKRTGTRRNEIVTSSVKKAIVRVKSGEKIALFDIST